MIEEVLNFFKETDVPVWAMSLIGLFGGSTVVLIFRFFPNFAKDSLVKILESLMKKRISDKVDEKQLNLFTDKIKDVTLRNKRKK